MGFREGRTTGRPGPLGRLLARLTARGKPPLSSARASFADLLGDSRAIALLVDPRTGAIEDASAAAAEFYGVARKALRGRALWELDTYGEAAVRDELERIASGMRRYVQSEHRGAAGETLSVEIHAAVVSEGDRSLALLLVHDISTQRRTEEELLRQSTDAHKLALVASRTQSAVIITDALGRCEWCNDAFSRLSGYALDEIRGRRPWRLLRAPIVAGASSLADAVRRVAQGETVACESVARSRDGERRFLHLDLQPVRTPAGLLTHYMAVIHDITARRESEERLAQTNDFLAKIIDTAATAIFTIDATRRITNVNAAFCAMTGHFPDEVLGKSCREILGESCNVEECTLFDGPEVSGPIYQRESHVRTKDGRLLTVLKNADVIVDQEGNATIGVESFTDVTELIRARRQAEAATEAKSRFLANMSHEIRTPMNGIIGMNDLLLETNLDDEQKALALTARAAAESLLDVIDDILDFSKVEAGKLKLEAIEFDPGAVVEQALDTVVHRAEQRGLGLVARLDPDLPPSVIGDPGRLRQVLLNLLSNAIKFTQVGEIVVRGDVVEMGDESVLLRFAVEDPGIGIDEAKLSGIFDPFTQADSSTTRRFGGTGLGLSISKALTTLMGGEIGATSREGEGSEFWFTTRAGRVRSAKRSQPLPDAFKAVARRVLICDPSREGRAALEAWLAHWGFDVVATNSADAALARLRAIVATEGSCAAVLVDLGLPGESALELGVALREHPDFRDIPRVLVGRISELPDAARWRAHGYPHYLLRPVKRAALLGAIRAALGIDEVPVGAAAAPGAVPLTPTAVVPGKLRVLVAEDNPINQKVALRVIERLGHHATAVANGREAVEAVAEGHFNVVLMDCQMPELDGYEATRAIRRLPTGKREIRIVAMTANALKGDRERCLAAGMDDYVAKPIRPETLARALMAGHASRV